MGNSFKLLRYHCSSGGIRQNAKHPRSALALGHDQDGDDDGRTPSRVWAGAGYPAVWARGAVDGDVELNVWGFLCDAGGDGTSNTGGRCEATAHASRL